MTLYLSFALAAVLVLAGAALLAVALRARARTGTLPRVEAGLAAALMTVGALLVYRLQAPVPPPPTAAADAPPPRASSPVLSTKPNVPAPELVYTLLDGTTERLSSLRGKVVLVNFWATWCGPCLKELPALSDVSDKLSPLGLVVVTISSEPPDTVRAFVEKTPLRTVVATAAPEALTGPLAGGLDNLPTTFVIDREGTVVAREIGARTRETFEALVAGPLAPNLAMR